ncbi:MAG: hypothetical protein HDT32_06955 [Clostridiales bacterium]|nr:hypothetical protein [Clostridiales bacterium]
MLCERCRKRMATTFMKVNGCDMELCEVCASGLNIYSPMIDFFDMLFDVDDYIDERYEERVCPNCGLRESQLIEGYKFGCSKCYDVFADKADEYFRELRGVEYRGRFASTASARKHRYLKDATKADLPHLYEMLQYPSIKSDGAKTKLIIDKIKELEGGR